MDVIKSSSFDGGNFSIVIVSGLSGSGKSTALAVFEDMGFLTVDGIPAILAPQIIDMITGSGAGRYNGIAFGMDLRQDHFYREYEQALVDINDQGITPQVLFCEASTDILLKRYATTRRPHPLQKEGFGLEQAIDMEVNRLRRLRNTADLVLDTSTFSVHDLRRAIQGKWKNPAQMVKSLRVHIISFGFKYGTPAEADMVFDLRFLPNPYFVPELKALSGCDAPVAEYVLEQKTGKEFLHRLTSFLSYVLKQNEAEGRFRLTAAFGCTGGRHRSVAVAEAIAAALRAEAYTLTLEHRHLNLG